MIITFGGTPGSGKSTIARRLAQRLGYRRYYMGQIMRDLAKKRGMTMEEFGKLCEQDSTADRQVDAYQEKLGRRYKNLVVEGRTSFHFIPHSIKIFLSVTPAAGARRILGDMKENKKRNEVRAVASNNAFVRSVKRRILSEKRRYWKWFRINPFDKRNYDLYLDTSHLDQNQVFESVLAFLVDKGLKVPNKKKRA